MGRVINSVMKIANRIIILTVLLTASGLITPLYAKAHQKDVVFDEGHGQRFLIDKNDPLDLSKLSGLFKSERFIVRSSKSEITSGGLAEVDVLVISGAFKPFTKKEISTISLFVKQGGKLCIMLHIGLPVADLLRKFNVVVSNGVVREQENLIQNGDLDYYITKLDSHELFEGIEQFKVFGGWAVFNTKNNADIIAQTSPSAWIDLNGNNKRDNNEGQQRLGLVIAGTFGKGHFVVFGDDAIFQNRFLSGGNVTLAKNLARWLGRKK